VSLGALNDTVNYIVRGFVGGGCSNSARKKHLRAIKSIHASAQNRPRIPAITFTDDDFTTIDPTQDDPMVITVQIDKFAITKVLVDQDSLVEILYWKTFKKKRISETKYSLMRNRLSGSQVSGLIQKDISIYSLLLERKDVLKKSLDDSKSPWIA